MIGTRIEIMDIQRLQTLAGIIIEGRPGRKEKVQMLHGTSSKFISSIKKFGLQQPSKGTVGYGSSKNEAYRSYGGVYLTPELDQALSAAYDVTEQTNEQDNTNQYVPVIVIVQMVVGSAGLDEDEVIPDMMEVYNMATDEVDFVAGMIKILRPHILPRGNVKILYDLFAYFREKNPTNDSYTQGRERANDVLKDERFRALVTKLIDSIKAGSDPYASVRVTRDIGWSGDTKILNIVGENDPILDNFS